jgi:Tfp pilus assembly protein PilO
MAIEGTEITISPYWSFVFSIFSSGVVWGVMSTKVTRLEKDMEIATSLFVTKDLFEANLRPLQKNMDDMQSDVKKILRELEHNSALLRSCQQFRDCPPSK